MRGWRSLISVAVFVLAVVPARAQTPVEAFVQQSIDRGIALLKDKSLDPVTRRRQVGDFLAEVFDTRRMAVFMLGPARQKASASELDAYAEAYRAFILASYGSQLDGYEGQTLKVTDSQARAPGDYVVNAAVIDPAVPNDPMPLSVSFRVEDEGDGKFAVVDAGIAGIWLGLAQQAEFGAYLSQHGNSVPGLTAYLQQMTRKLSSPEAGMR
jgi:ABC-type transporter MlaC component